MHVRTLGLQRAPTSTSSPALAAIPSAVLTFDLDFGAILALGVLDKPSVITFRLADERPASVTSTA